MLDPPSLGNDQPSGTRPDPNDPLDQTDPSPPNNHLDSQSATSGSQESALVAEPLSGGAGTTASTSTSGPNPGSINSAISAASRLVRAFERMQNGPAFSQAFTFQHPPTEPTRNVTGEGNGEIPSGSAPASGPFEQAFPSADLLDLIISQSLAAQSGIRRMQAREAAGAQGTPDSNTNQSASTNSPGPFQQISSANILAGLFGLVPGTTSNTNVPGPGTAPNVSTTAGATTSSVNVPASVASGAAASNTTAGVGPNPTGPTPAASTALGDDIGAIIITINYRFNNDDAQNPNQNGSLVISVPNTSNNRHPEALEAYLHLATRLAYEDFFRNLKTGITEEKFESFEVVPVDELTDRVCSICFEPYEGLEPLNKMADSIALKRRKLSPDEHSVSLSESEERVEEPARSRTPSANAPVEMPRSSGSTSNGDSWTSTSGSDATRLGDSNASSQTSGPAYLCDQDKEFSHEAIKFPCGHIFGKSCLAHWLKTATTCPLCRFNVSPTSTENSGREMPDAPPPGPAGDFLHLFPDWIRPPPVDQTSEPTQPQTETPAVSGSQLLALALTVSSATSSHNAAAPPSLSRSSTISSVLSEGLGDTRSESSHSSGTPRVLRPFDFLRRSTQSILRRTRRHDAPPTPIIRPGTERRVPTSFGSQGLDSSDGSNSGFEARRFIVRNPSFAPVIEGISNILRSPRVRSGNAGGENSIFASGVSSRRTADGVETTTTEGMTLRNASAESVIIFSPNYFMSRPSQGETANANATSAANDSTSSEDGTNSSTNDRQDNSTLNGNR